ncbi:hypothetical protein AtNW77_Chr4g0283281 [Arabidopsis thaliana]
MTKSLADSMLRYVKRSTPLKPNENPTSVENDKAEEICEDTDVNMNTIPECVYSGEKNELLEITDPANWKNIDRELRDFLVEKGPMKRVHENYAFPKTAGIRRHFSHRYYKREMKNGDKQDRNWLLYSKVIIAFAASYLVETKTRCSCQAPGLMIGGISG